MPEVLIDFFDGGALRANARDPADERAVTLASFLQSDVQASRLTAEEWLDRIAAVERGAVPDDEGTGNAYTLTLDPDGATLEHAIFTDWPSHRYSLAELRTALTAVVTALGRQAV